MTETKRKGGVGTGVLADPVEQELKQVGRGASLCE